MAAIVGEAFEVAHDIVARDHVEHDLHTLPAGDPRHFLDKVGGLVVDRVICPDLERGSAFVRPAAGDDHRQPERLAEHDRHGADPAGPAVNQQRLAFFGPAAFEHVVPDGEQRFGQGRGLVEREVRRHREAKIGRCKAVLRIAPARYQRADLLAEQRRIDPFAEQHNLPRDLEPGDWRSARRRGVKPLTLDHIGPVDPGESDLNQHLAWPGLRHSRLRQAQHIGAAGCIETRHLHGFRYNISHLTTPVAAKPLAHSPSLQPC